MPKTMSQSLRHNFGLLALTATAWTAAGTSASAEVGDEIVNVANVTYTSGVLTTEILTNEAVFTIQSPETPINIEFFRFSPNAPNPDRVAINGSDFSPSGDENGTFTAIGPARNTNGQIIDLSSPVPLIPATTFLTGEVMFLRVTDQLGNQDSNVIDTVVIEIESDSGDIIVLRLYESGPSTGLFYAYLPSTETATSDHDSQLTTGANSEITATYVNTLSSTNVTVDTALVNPRNTVFNSVTGEPIDGAVITLVNADTGETAGVFGIDGFSAFPSVLTSGEDVSDASDLFYDVDTGGFRFPHAESGRYFVNVDPPEGYTFASVLEMNNFGRVETPFVVTDASYGRPFTVTQSGPLRFDIPLDPQTDLVLSKSVDQSFGDVGDFINYTVTVENRGRNSAPILLNDSLPIGFRYIQGTTRIERQHVSDPLVSADATLLTFPLATLAPGEIRTLNYALEIGPGAPMGDAINRAVVVDGNDQQVSNIARASIRLREDLLRSRSTIVGRIAENACDENQDWAREIRKGDGVEGVRLYMENGAYAVSDLDGLYHFEGVSEGTHVVQIDQETLPKGYTPMVCEESTRYAGKATSAFVDVQGGGVWRTNFYLKRTGVTDDIAEDKVFNDATEYKDYDVTWLETQTGQTEWVYPSPERTPSKSSINIGIKHGPGEVVQLIRNGHIVSSTNFAEKITNNDRSAQLSRWRGVDLLEGRNVFDVVIKNTHGQELRRFSQEISFVKTIARAYGIPNQSELTADGRTVPVLAIRLEDEAGRPVHAGRIATIDVEPPYRLYDETGERRLQEDGIDVIAPFSARQGANVGPDGIVRLQLEPTLRTGKVTAHVTLDNGRIIPIYMYLEPEKRDWIIVGLAEGTAGYETVKDKAIDLTSNSESDTVTDGRVAFFAKGLIKGEWLMTLAVDTDKRRGDIDGDFEGEIDPNAYYTLYGDRSYQEFEGISRYPVFVKLEKRSAYAMFGDFDTNVTEGRLTAYNRRLSGLKAEYLGDTFQVLGFAAETNQGFAKDELPADGTSGTYQLSNTHILAQSEEVAIETRDRNRPDIILERRVLVRYLDYTLDYLTGELIFRLPVDVSDANFNPNVIVADYETAQDAERNITFGGRVQAQIADGKVQIGSTFVQEDGSAQVAGAKQIMVGVDAVAQVTQNTELRAEYAITDDQSIGGGTSDAILAEVIHTSETVTGEAYFREEDSGFGLGQRNSNTNRIRRYGASGSYKFHEFEDEKTGRRGSRSVDATVYREENLETGNQRTTGEVLGHHHGERLSVSAGLRASRDEFVDQDDRESVLGVLRGSYQLPKHGLTVQASHEQPLGGKDAVTNFPQRTTLGVDKTLGDIATVTLRHEILDGANASGDNTTIGLSASPWNGTSITAATDLLTNDLGRRLGATIGVDQQVKLSDRWSLSAGLRNRKVLDQQGTFVEVAPDAAISPLEVNEDFTSAYVGAAYRTEVMTATARLEGRNSSAGDNYTLSAGIARELSEELSLAGALRGFRNMPDNSDDDESLIDARLGAAWRPRDEDLIIFDRLDISHNKRLDGTSSTKIVNNVAVNTQVNDRLQVTGNWGAKYARSDIGDTSISGWTHLLGGEARFDVNERIDIGLRGSFLADGGFKRAQYSFGPSIGVSPVDNVWISAGYNISGYTDDDFEASEYSREGLYLQFRLKFDQDSARGLLRRISPASTTGPAYQQRGLSQP